MFCTLYRVLYSPVYVANGCKGESCFHGIKPLFPVVSVHFLYFQVLCLIISEM